MMTNKLILLIYTYQYYLELFRVPIYKFYLYFKYFSFCRLCVSSLSKLK